MRTSPSTAGIHGIADREGLLGEDFVREDSLHGLGATAHDRHDCLVVVAEQPADVADLAAGIGVEAGGVEHRFAGFAGREGLDAEAVFHQSEDLCAVDAERGVALKVGLGKLAVDGRCGLLRAALPGGAGAGLLFFLGGFEAFEIKCDPCVAGCADHEVNWKPEGLVEVEGIRSCEYDRLAQDVVGLTLVASILRR